jgi:soluble lytic murein transglycosylase-like protein
MKTESDFNKKAVSPKNYKGLMQTPKATFEYPEVDTLYGVKILEDKLKSSNGNMLKALALYKGGDNPIARLYAKEVYVLYKKLLVNNN